ncbi:MAG: PSD1 and planctomycete cytochrome C domain-containing protein [Saprospiraceae bacterium]
MKALLSNKIFLFGILLAVGVLVLANRHQNAAPVAALPEVVDFNWHIRPILSDRCFKCHGPDEKKREAGLRLDTEEGAFGSLSPNDAPPRYAIVPYHPEQSALIQRIYSTNPDSVMPTPDSHLSLNAIEKALLKRWIEQGAKWKPHWAFIQPVKAPLPEPPRKRWAKNEIDLFTLQKMAEQGLEPSPEADRNRLLRRVSFDLTGLPPSPQLMAQFLNDNSPGAYERAVDSLLASPAYGERWAMYWLDLARYSDTHGYQDDLPRTMWPWRDWVIHAFNQNMPYDRFVTEQLAGDLLPDADKATLLASAFNRNHKISQEGGVIDEEYRVEYVADRTNTFGKAFLGLTFECSRCHDHKYDPIPMSDYYGTFAFFNKVPERGFVPNLQVPKPYIPIVQADLQGVLSFLNADSVLRSPKDTLLQMVMKDSLDKGGRQTFILRRGQYDQPTVRVEAHAPSAVLPFDTATLPRNRLGLAQWLFDRRNPLTARVAVNHLWQEIFGRGIVATPDNFGVQGALPTHPELLDWLAVDFMENGWDQKALLRKIVTSATYRQASAASPETLARDPENRWLAHGPRYRMPYEFIRDNLLAASGLLNRIIGGPSVKPWQPPGLWEEISTEKTANNFRGEFTYIPDTLPSRLYRRSLYTYHKRTIPPPASLVFDAPMRDNCEVRRTRTSTPLQALNLLNDPQVLEASRVLAQRLLQDAGLGAPDQQIAEGFLRIMGRAPEREELGTLTGFYKEELQRYQTEPDNARQLIHAGRYPAAPELDPARHAALMLTINAVMNLDEAMSKT